MADDRTIRALLLALMFGLIIGTVYSLYQPRAQNYPQPASEQPVEGMAIGRHNTTIGTVLGANGTDLTYIRPPAYGTPDFEGYKAERVAILNAAAIDSPGMIVEATITFYPAARTDELESYKNKYSLKLLGITGSSSGTLNYSEAPVLNVNDELIGEKLSLFSRIYNAKAKAAIFDLENLSREPDVILVDLNIDNETHAPVLVPRR